MAGLPLTTPISAIPRYGKLFAKRLLRLKITTVRDLLLYFPFRYEDLSHVASIEQLKIGETATVRGIILDIKTRRSPRKHLLLTDALVRDATGAMRVVWFRQPFLTKVLTPGTELWLSGTVADDGYGMHMTNPVYEKVDKESLHTGRIVPIYPLREGTTQKQLRTMIRLALGSAHLLSDELPPAIEQKEKLMPLSRAVQTLHFPSDFSICNRARHRMAFAEFFTLHCQLFALRKQRTKENAPPIQFFEDATRAFVRSLPFTLTDDQRKASWEILQDIQKGVPMLRLLNGDVGSGKTVVAAIAAWNVVQSGYRVLFMAPTEILAEQHARTFTEFFTKRDVRVSLMTASHRSMRKDAMVIIGTQALLYRKHIDKVGLIIVDEQHRFGVVQRTALVQEHARGMVPHFLSMTATPIPRTLAHTLFGDLDISLLRAMPKGRQKIVTRVITAEERQYAYAAIRSEIQKGHQAFVICPLIDPSDTLGVRAATDVFTYLQKEIFPNEAVALLHGRIAAKDRERIMQDVVKNRIAILVATSVIEVGIDVPNATIMLIEGAERFGIAQLHQLRGRVGRGEHQSHCFLFTESSDADTLRRLRAVEASQDGFALAEADLRFRGPGEFIGTQQSGYLDFRFARWNDIALICATRKAAEDWCRNHGA